MISKAILRKRHYSVIIVVLALTFLGALGFVFWDNFIPSIIKGKITEKRTSCGREILGNDGKPKRVKGICDSSNSIVVNGVSISTGGIVLGSNRPKYITDINSLQVGDLVEVKYIQNSDGRYSTDCESCYVKKEDIR